jgi:hypothetical protein
MTQKSEPEVVVQNSLGLKALCQKLEGISGLKVLELGPARSANIEFWSRYGSCIFIADLRAGLPLPFLAEDQQFPESEWDRILGLPEGRFYDVILAWDLLNYIELSTLPSLISYLSRFCRPGTILFFLIFDQPQMPEKITVYRIVDEQHIAYENGSVGKRVCPRHQPRALTKLLSQFQASDSFRLKNGIMEYLFTCENI